MGLNNTCWFFHPDGSWSEATAMEFGLLFIFFLSICLFFFIREVVSCVEKTKAMVVPCKTSCSSPAKEDYSSLLALRLQGSISFDAYSRAAAAQDFGNIFHHSPAAVVFPASAQDIVTVVRAAARSSHLTVAARGHGHSIYGQAQAKNGVVIDMSTLKGIEIHVGQGGEMSYADVSGGELWIDLLRVSLRKGLAPRSWTDYLYLSIGGTLQNAGVGGQTFKHGPQISNVLQLEVVTGKGDLIACSPTQSPDLFYGTLGGLGQFGIITKARIILEPAPPKVRWVRALYSDLATFMRDQEFLISTSKDVGFDYIEGFVLCNSDDPTNGWPQVPFLADRSLSFNLIPREAGPVLYCLELAKGFNADDACTIEQKVLDLLAPLSFIPGLLFTTDVTYFDFLNRVYPVEVKLRSLGIWQAPHPWLCLFVPKSELESFDAAVFKKKLSKGIGGPMLLYAMSKSKWDKRFSVVVPEEEVFYMVALLRWEESYPKGRPVECVAEENEEVLRACRRGGIHVKHYLPWFSGQREWAEQHFGHERWERLCCLKLAYDPHAILAPSLSIFPRSTPTLTAAAHHAPF